MKRRLAISCFALLAAALIALADTATFTYDTAGRLIATTHSFTNVATFQYDVSGNLTRSAAYTVADSDSDGMADAWEQSFFGTLSRTGTNDFDIDGFSDVAEYLAGTLPNNPNSLLRMNRNVTNSVVQTTVGWSSIAGKTYRVQYKNALTDFGWNDLPGTVPANGTNTLKIDTTSSGQPQRYYRVEVLP